MDEIRRHLERIRERLGSGSGGASPTLAEWTALQADVPRFEAIVDREVQNNSLPSAFRVGIRIAWDQFRGIFDTEVAQCLARSAIPAVDLELRVHAAIQSLMGEIAKVMNDPGFRP